MSIKEYAKTKDKSILINAKNKIENNCDANQQGYEYLILNHIGLLVGIYECGYTEAFQYIAGDLLKHNKKKYIDSLDSLSKNGFGKAKKSLASEYISTDPNLALRLYFDCLNDSNVDQGEINEQIGYVYFVSETLDTREAFQYLKIAADQYNKGFAQYLLASMFFYGDGVDENIEISYSYCLKAANNDEEHAEFWLGKDYLIASEYPLDRNIELGIQYLKKAASQYNYNAQYYLGFIYYDGEFVQKDITQSEYYLKHATYGNVPGAFAYLGQVYFDKGNYEEARKYLEISYYKYNSLLWTETLVKIYKEGYGCQADIPKAVHLIEEMISKNASNLEDVEFVANCYYKGIAVEQDINKAVGYYALIENDNPYVKYVLGCIALDGVSTILSKNDCIRYFEYAGNKGYSLAFSKLGYYFLSINNSDRALDYFKRSFNAGNIDDGVMAGRIYEEGTPSMYKNMSEAVNWYKAAAEKGSAKAKEELTHIKSGIFGYKRI